MEQKEIRIEAAERQDAPGIGETVVTAIGMDLSEELAGGKSAGDVLSLFTALAAREDSQYSYLNALKAVDADGKVMGYVVGYDGACLHALREAFFEEMKKRLNRDFESEFEGGVPDETTPEEYYIDSLAVWPEYRGRGVGRALITAMKERADAAGKPMGLLCDKSNARARRLYESIGFRKVGETYFAFELMDHFRL